YHEKNAVKRIGERDFMIAGIIHDTDNHTGDVDCEPYPINNGKSAWVYRLYDPLDGVNSLSYASLKTYPNPANNQLFIDLPEHHNKVEIEIIDVFGHAIKKINALAQQTQVLWDCSKTATGVYFYQSEINGVVYRGKIVVQ
ncbi:MAG: hypothetical protein B7C24_13120, partial [Bacteroidetes bacterium 4572_77]